MYLEEIIENVQLESDKFECKAKLNRDDIVGWLKTIAGFANASGGDFYIGVEDKTNKLIGFDRSEADNERNYFHNQVNEHLVPRPQMVISFVRYEIKGKERFVIRVQVGDSVIKPVILKYKNVPSIYMRRDGFTNGATYEEIIDMTARDVSDTMQKGGTVLYTARCSEFRTEEGQAKGAEICRKHGIDGIVVIGGDGSYRGAQALARHGINTIGVPGTIDLDIACTDYTIGFDTAVNTAMEAIDKVRDTSTSHERCSIIEVMGRHAGHIALWCGIANGAEDILLPERYDGNEQYLINRIIENRKRGKKHHIIINAEGIGHSTSMARRIEAATGVETRATIIGYIQRGGTPTCKDRVYASIMGAKAAELMASGKSNRVVAYKNGEFIDYDIQEALNMTKDIPEEQFEISKMLVR